MAHTPGPWLIEYAETGVRWPVIYVHDEAWDDDKRSIAQIDGHVAERERRPRPGRKAGSKQTESVWHPTDGAAEIEANARLIATAPELLDACLAALDDANHGEPSDGRTINALTAAIKKATDPA